MIFPENNLLCKRGQGKVLDQPSLCFALTHDFGTLGNLAALKATQRKMNLAEWSRGQLLAKKRDTGE